MSDPIYNETHVVISRVLGRNFNNPLGPAALRLLSRLIQNHAAPRILDAGCGRGRTAIWWAQHTGATIDAFDPSRAMLDEALENVATTGLEARIRLFHTDISGYRADEPYDLVMAHDVLCYSGDRAADALVLAGLLKDGGILSISDYWRDRDSVAVGDVLGEWGIGTPLPFRDQTDLLTRNVLLPLFQWDTTRQYRDHWFEMRQNLADRRRDVLELVDQADADGFGNKIDAILRAVDGGGYGHCWSILEKCR